MEGVSLAERQVCEASKAVAEQHKEKANAAFKGRSGVRGSRAVGVCGGRMRLDRC